MGRYVYVISSNAIDGKEEEYNSFYTDIHLPDMLSVDGVRSAQRFKIVDGGSSQASQYKYLCIYDIETENLQQVIEEIGRRSGSERMGYNPGFERGRHSEFWYQAITPILNEETHSTIVRKVRWAAQPAGDPVFGRLEIDEL